MEYIEQLSLSVKLRVQDIPRLSGYGLLVRDKSILSALCRELFNSPRVAVLFSGGIDCTLIAYLSHLLVAELPTEGLPTEPSCTGTFQSPNQSTF